jgi:hypothetical protein
VAVWLRMVDGERYRLAQKPGETDDQVMRAILDGTVHGWAPVVRSGSGWMLVNLAHVVRVETGPEDASHLGFG